MPLTKPNGNMFPNNFVDYCLSYLVGGCQYQCRYCYVPTIRKRFRRKDDNMPYWYDMPYRAKKVHIPKGRVFINHTTDGFAANLAHSWIEDYLENIWHWYNANNQENTFIFLTKNASRLKHFNYIFERFPEKALLFGITLESNTYAYQPIEFVRDEKNHPLEVASFTKAMNPRQRAEVFADFIENTGNASFISVEPILEFDLDDLIYLIEKINPQLVFIGADSKRSNVKEPNSEKIVMLINALTKFTDVRLKKNLYRLIPGYLY